VTLAELEKVRPPQLGCRYMALRTLQNERHFFRKEAYAFLVGISTARAAAAMVAQRVGATIAIEREALKRKKKSIGDCVVPEAPL